MSGKNLKRPTFAQINLKALRHNYLKIRSLLPKNCKILTVVKQDAYGHGMIEVSRVLEELGVEFLGVARVDEALSLRQEGIKSKILNLGVILSWQDAQIILDSDVSQTVNTLTQAQILNYAAYRRRRKAKVHLNIDTGMTRLGIPIEESRRFLVEFLKFKNLELEGVYTHFPSAEKDRNLTLKQVEKFKDFVDFVCRKGVNKLYLHCANSAGVLKYPSSYFNLVRPGLCLYGVNPSGFKPLKEFKPAMEVKSKVVFVRKIPARTPVSYGGSFVSSGAMYTGVVPIGYGDGYPFSLSGKAEVLIRGRKFPVLGRVCMDFIIVGSRKKYFSVGDEVLIMGSSTADTQINCEDIARKAGTIPYEVLCRFGKNLPRVFLG